MEKVRMIYSISKDAVNLSHSDVVKEFEKSLDKVKNIVPIKYTKGQNSKPELEFACMTPTGMETFGEIAEIILEDGVPLSYLVKEINNVMPDGIIILSAEYISMYEEDISLRIYAARYEIKFDFNEKLFIGKNNREIEDIKKWYIMKMYEYLSQDFILVIKKSKNRMERIDIKPQIRDYRFLIDGSLIVTVDMGSKSNLRPEYIMIGYNEYIDQDLKYTIKRGRILYD